MASPHKKSVYKPIELKNPFKTPDSADKAYSDILYDKMKETNLWRKSLFISVGLFVIALILFFVSVNQQAIIPVLVNVMPSGESQYLGEVRQQGSVQVPEASITWWIKTFITNYRTISTDYMVVYANIDDCFVMVTNNYSQILRETLKNDSPFTQIGKIRRSIEIESILHITGMSYNVNWKETTFDTSASQTSKKMRAVVSIRLVVPTEATIKRNPLGIYIENFEMTEL